MARKQLSDRRSVLKMIGSLAAASVGVTTAGGAATATEPQTTGEAGDEMVPGRTALTGPGGAVPSGLYRGTVDRIVDGEHVVILLEDDGEVVAEVVRPSERYPGLEEGERVLVWMHDGDLLAVW